MITDYHDHQMPTYHDHCQHDYLTLFFLEQNHSKLVLAHLTHPPLLVNHVIWYALIKYVIRNDDEHCM